ncbi:hypothetical protein MN116_008058 [Schistosoma mekongi]|uniref:IRS-type PTB domain-containing protein n=1 Tax=Schistosoma mekongi TaxID=38744 RepID=A0AAE1Z860_SCHME|nr:hypothetical protein MN116_008058 [Schistosoma mekongi]
MQDKSHVVVYSAHIYKFKTHRPQYLEIVTQSNYKNPYLIIYHNKSKWKCKFNSETSWLTRRFSFHLHDKEQINTTRTSSTITTNDINRYELNCCHNNPNNYSLKQTNSTIQSLHDLFHAAVIHRDYKPIHSLSIKSSKSKLKWFHSSSQKSLDYFKFTSSVMPSAAATTPSSAEAVNSLLPPSKSYQTKSLSSIINNNSHLTNSTSFINFTINLSSNVNQSTTFQRMSSNHQIEYNNNNNKVKYQNSNKLNLLLGLFMESGKYVIIEFNCINEMNLCLTTLNKIITMNKQINAYPDIEFTWSVNVHFKPKDYTSVCLIPNSNGSHYLCLTSTEILLIQGNLRVPKLIILYRFIRQCISRRDGQFRLYTGRASPIGECEIIFELADYVEAQYVHEQCARLMHQSSRNKPSLSVSSLSSSSSSKRSNFKWNQFGYNKNNLPPLPRPISSLSPNTTLMNTNLQPIKRLIRSKSMPIYYTTNTVINDKSNSITYKNNLSHQNGLHQSYPILYKLKKNYYIDNLYQSSPITSSSSSSSSNYHQSLNTLTLKSNKTFNQYNNEYLLSLLKDSNENLTKDDNESVILRNHSSLRNRKKAFSACSPSDAILSLHSSLFPNIKESKLSIASVTDKIISHRDNSDLFAQLFFDSYIPYHHNCLSPYHGEKYDSCTNQLCSLTSLHNSAKSSSLFTNSSTSIKSHNSLFHNNITNNNNNDNRNNNGSIKTGTNTTCNSMSNSFSPMMIATSSGSSLFFNCGNSTHGGSCSSNSSNSGSTDVRPRTSSDVSNIRRSYHCHSHIHQYNPHLLMQNHISHHHLHDSQHRENHCCYSYPLSDMNYQALTKNSFSSLKLCRDLTSINELQRVNNSPVIDPLNRPRAATIDSNSFLSKQRLSIVLNHLKMNCLKKLSTYKNIKHNNPSTNKPIVSSRNDYTKKINTVIYTFNEKVQNNHENDNNDEYIEAFSMNINSFTNNNLDHLKLYTESIPNLSNHYMLIEK